MKKMSWAGALGHASADKRIEILRLIGAGGSISQAAREAGVSYKAAWQAIDTLTNLAGVTLVERVVGGAGGGGARLTEAARQLLTAAGQVADARRAVLASLSAPAAEVARLAIRTSMRNQLPCTVQAVALSGQLARVELRLPDGTALASRITRESAELLGLAPGLAVLALCKATAVEVRAHDASAADFAARDGALLAGRATRVSRGAAGDEVALALEAGLQLVGFARPGSGLRVRSRVQAWVDASTVVVALAD
jgi:molybdate transport system regulatory protein